MVGGEEVENGPQRAVGVNEHLTLTDLHIRSAELFTLAAWSKRPEPENARRFITFEESVDARKGTNALVSWGEICVNERQIQHLAIF